MEFGAQVGTVPANPGGAGTLATGSLILLPAGTLVGYLVVDGSTSYHRQLRLQSDALAQPSAGDVGFYVHDAGTYDFGARQPDLKLYHPDQHSSSDPLLLALRDPATGDSLQLGPGEHVFLWTSGQPWTINYAAPGTVMPTPASCPPGLVMRTDGACGCPSGQTLTESGTCWGPPVASDASTPWYHKPSTWLLIGGGVVVTGLLVWAATRKKSKDGEQE